MVVEHVLVEVEVVEQLDVVLVLLQILLLHHLIE